MRILIPLVLVVAALGGAYWLVGRGASDGSTGTGPNAVEAPRDSARANVELAAGDPGNPARTAADRREAVPAARANDAQPAAPAPVEVAEPEPTVPEPVMQSGVALDPAGGRSAQSLDQSLEAKYRDWTRLERERAIEALRTTLQSRATSSSDKSAEQVSYADLKHELIWLEAHLDG